MGFDPLLMSKYVKIAIENGPIEMSGVFPFEMVIFHGYVELPEGNWLELFRTGDFYWILHSISGVLSIFTRELWKIRGSVEETGKP